MASVVPATPIVPSQPYAAPAQRTRMPRRLTISIINDPPSFADLAKPPTAAPTPAPSSANTSSPAPACPSLAPPPGLGDRRLSVTRSTTPSTSAPARPNPYAAGGTLSEVSTSAPVPTAAAPARPRSLLPPSTTFYVASPAPPPTSKPSSNPYASGGALSPSAPAPTPAPAKPKVAATTRPINLRVLTPRQIQDMARAAQAAHNHQVQARMVAESILNRVRRRAQRRRFPRFAASDFSMGMGTRNSPLRKLAFDESDMSDDSSSDGSVGGGRSFGFGDWSSEDGEGSDDDGLEAWEREMGDVAWFVDNGFDD